MSNSAAVYNSIFLCEMWQHPGVPRPFVIHNDRHTDTMFSYQQAEANKAKDAPV